MSRTSYSPARYSQRPQTTARAAPRALGRRAQGVVVSGREVRQILPGLPMACFSLNRKGQTRTSGFAYVFLNSRGATCSNLRRVVGDSLERSLRNRIQRWAMVTVSSPQHDFQTPEGEEALRRFMAEWWPTLWAAGEPPHE